MPSPSVILNCKKTIAQSYLNLNMLITLIFQLFFQQLLELFGLPPKKFRLISSTVHSQDPRELVGGASDEMQSGSALLWAWKLRAKAAGQCEDQEKQI